MIIKNNVDKQYLSILNRLVSMGQKKSDRTGVGTYSLFSETMKFNLNEGFPLLTSKEVKIKSVIHELIWFLSGNTNIKYLVDNKVGIWNANAYDYYKRKVKTPVSKKEWLTCVKKGNCTQDGHKLGDIGKAYGYQWRKNGIDQIKTLIENLKKNPNSRRLLVNAWNHNDISLDDVALPPCHTGFQCYVNELNGEQYLSLHFQMRSNDFFLGNPFNIASYALLLHIIANIVGMKPKELSCNLVDVHLYQNHLNAAYVQLNNETFDLPKLIIKEKITDIDLISADMFEIKDYKNAGRIKAKMAV